MTMLQFSKNKTTSKVWDLTHFMPVLSFYTLWKYLKIRGFVMFSGGMEGIPCHEMGEEGNKLVLDLLRKNTYLQ